MNTPRGLRYACGELKSCFSPSSDDLRVEIALRVHNSALTQADVLSYIDVAWWPSK